MCCNLKAQTILDVGDMIVIDKTRFRVLAFQKETVLINIDSGKTDIRRYDMDEILEGIKTGKCLVIKKDISRFLMDDENPKYQQRLALIQDIEEKYQGDFVAFYDNHSKQMLDFLMDKHGFSSPATFWRIVRQYMQSGYEKTSLMPIVQGSRRARTYTKTNCGAKNADGIEGYIVTIRDKEAIEYAIRKYSENDYISLDEAYDLMLMKYYTHFETDSETGRKKRVINGYGNCPTRHQVYYRIAASSLTPEVKRKKAKSRKTKKSYVDPRRLGHFAENNA